MRLDPNVALENMSSHGIKGSSAWKKYSITLPLEPSKTERIVIGGILQGSGKAWFDNFSVQIDGKDITTIKKSSKFVSETAKDREFIAGSKIKDIDLTSCNVEYLKQLCYIWGFLKYYHPAVRQGKYNWDFELFRILPKIIAAESDRAKDAVLLDWIQGLGTIIPSTNQHTEQSDEKIFMEPDFHWIHPSNFSAELVNTLNRIKECPRGPESYYVSRKTANNPSFDHEEPYKTIQWTDTGYRILTLYRYWNIIQYFYPYKYLIENWDAALDQFLPQFIQVKTQSEYIYSLLELITQIKDTHAQLYAANFVYSHLYGTRQALPLVRFIADTAIVTGFLNDALAAGQTGLAVGDIITQIEGEAVDSIVQKMLPYTSASNRVTQLRNIARNLLRSNQNSINIGYIRNNRYAETHIPTYSEDSINLFFRQYYERDTCYRKLSPNISYLYPGTFRNEYIGTLWEHIKSSDGLIIDLRCYPGDFIVYTLGMLFVPDSQIFSIATIPSIELPGQYVYKTLGAVGKHNPFYYRGKIIILVDEQTQSNAEFTAMAFRIAPNATVIGSTTAGADGNVSSISLPGGLSTMISGIGIFYPDGSPTQGIGIVPDITLLPTTFGVQTGQDELIEKAKQIILQQL